MEKLLQLLQDITALNFDEPTTLYGAIAVIAVALTIVFFIIREIVAWYFKISRLIALLQQNNRNQEDLLDKIDSLIEVSRRRPGGHPEPMIKQ